MMKLHEYQAKQIFARYSLPIPKGYVCNTFYEIEESISKIGPAPWVMKCQIHAGGRGKSGGVKIVQSREEVRAFAEQWLGNRLVTYQTNVQGQPVNQILVESDLTHSAKELYLGGIIDRSINRIVFMASNQGGIDIEQGVQEGSYLIHKVALDPLIGPQPYQGRELAFKLGLNGNQVNKFKEIFMGLATLFLDLDLVLVEVNPLVITSDDDLICLDGKLSTDGNAWFRQSNLREIHDNSQEDRREVYAMQLGFNYVTLDGNIGCMVNGAGLAMGTMDMIKLYGGEPANFLDVGGSTTKERVTDAFHLILSDKKVKAILVNIFGGIVRCDLISEGIIRAISEVNIDVPIIVRLEGNIAELGIKYLSNSGLNIIVAITLLDAAQQVVAAVRD